MNSSYDPHSLANEVLADNVLLLDKLVKNNVVKHAQEAEDGLAELLKFLFLCANNSFVLTPSLRIDAFWHEFMLFSRSYTAFCQQHFSRYIHHQPSDAPGDEMLQYQQTIQLYRQQFGALNTDFWVSAGICEQHCGSCTND